MRYATVAGLAGLLCLLVAWWSGLPNQDVVPPEHRAAMIPPPAAQPRDARAGNIHGTPTPQVASPDSPASRLLELLRQERYQAAVAWYDDVSRTLNDASNRALRDLIVDHARELQTSLQPERVSRLLGEYTGLFYKDVAALLLLARSQHSLGLFDAEIATLYQALNEAYQQTELSALRRQLQAAVGGRLAQLRTEQNPQAVISFYQDLLAREPDYGPFQLGLAAAAVASGDFTTARRQLRLISDPQLMDEADALWRQMADRSPPVEGDTAILPLQRAGAGFVVSATLNRIHPVRLLIDTGATLTMMRPETLRRAGVATDIAGRSVRFDTASGSLSAPVVRIDTLSLDNLAVSDLDIGVITLPNLTGVDGLLGMNYLRHFRFTVSQRDGTLSLSRTDPR